MPPSDAQSEGRAQGSRSRNSGFRQECAGISRLLVPCQSRLVKVGKRSASTGNGSRCERLTAADIRIAPRRRSSGRTLGNYLGFEGPVFPWGGRGGDCEAGPVCAALRPRALDDDTPAAASDQVAAPGGIASVPSSIRGQSVSTIVCALVSASALAPADRGGKPRGKRLLADLLAHGLPQRIELAAMPLGHRSIIGSEAKRPHRSFDPTSTVRF